MSPLLQEQSKARHLIEAVDRAVDAEEGSVQDVCKQTVF